MKERSQAMKEVGVEYFVNLHSLEPDEAALKGTIEILGASHHAWFIQVAETEDGIQAIRDPYKRLHKIVQQNGNTDLETVHVSGFPGQYVLSIYPFAR
jgi:hypothetical protein